MYFLSVYLSDIFVLSDLELVDHNYKDALFNTFNSSEKKKFRRKKFGTKILTKVKKVAAQLNKKIKVIPHNRASLKFFKSNKIQKNEIVRGYKY